MVNRVTIPNLSIMIFMFMSDIPVRPLGDTGAHVSALGLGGYHLGTIKSEREAIRLVHAAIDAGITFMDNAWEYHDGRSETLMGKAIADRRDDVFLMTKLCTHGRGRREAMRQLEQSLRRLKTDVLDLWQIHECVYDNDPERHFARDGAVEALARAQRDGKVRFIGFTGHKRSGHSPRDARRTTSRSTPASSRSTASTARSDRSSSEVLPELLRRRHRADRHEEPRRRRASGEEEGHHRRRRGCATP